MMKLFEKAKKVSIVRDLMDNPEKFILIAYVDDNDEIAIRIKRKEKKEGV